MQYLSKTDWAISLAPIVGVMAGIVVAYFYFLSNRLPRLPKNKSKKIAGGDCPEDSCSGITYLVASESHSTLWRCEKCRTTWLLSGLPTE